jgi:asparagine synthase (glutamine-hydrolysing)
MCGISGIVGLANEAVVRAMADAQAHRGPDDAGAVVFDEQQVSLSHRRLSIIDLSAAGHQPMANANGSLWITYNGEIYNYGEIRRDLVRLGYRFRSESDTEVLLAAYEEWGEQCLGRLNGMFAFAIYDLKNRRLFAARDRMGIKPFYYYQKRDLFVFASEIKAILVCPGVEKRPDFQALCTPARYQVAPYTGFADIHKLPPAHYLTYENGNLSINRYWDIAPQEGEASDPDAVDRLDELLRDAVRLQMIADVPVGVFLSGGLDSSLISALMRQITDQEIHAFTIRFSELDQKHERMPDDSFYAKDVARKLNLTYHEFEIQPDVEDLMQKMIWHLDEPLSDPAALNVYLMAKAAREQGIVVLLNGMGADEMFGGYRKHLACLQAERYQNIVPKFIRSMAEGTFAAVPVATASRGFRTLRWAKRFLSFASLPPLERFLASDLALSKGQFESLIGREYEASAYYQAQKRIFEGYDGSLLTRMCINDTKLFLSEHNLTYTDKAAMAVGIEGRPPITDHRVAEYIFSLEPKFRIRGLQQKFLLKKVAERYLPNDIVYRPKASFGSPLRSWISGPLAGMVDDILSESSLRERQLYDPRAVRQLIARDRQGLEDNSMVIWTLLTTQLWFRTHFPN